VKALLALIGSTVTSQPIVAPVSHRASALWLRKLRRYAKNARA
jgi:hypothetical protein